MNSSPKDWRLTWRCFDSTHLICLALYSFDGGGEGERDMHDLLSQNSITDNVQNDLSRKRLGSSGSLPQHHDLRRRIQIQCLLRLRRGRRWQFRRSIRRAISRRLLIITQQRHDLVKISGLLATTALRLRASCHLAEDPFPCLEARIASVFLLGMRLFQEEDPDDHAAGDDHRAYEVGEEVREAIPDRAFGKYGGVIRHWSG